MPARYSFLSRYNCLYLRFEDPFLFGQSDSTFEAFTSAEEFGRSKTLIIDLSHLTDFKVDVTRSTEKTTKITGHFTADGVQFTILAPTEQSRTMADLLRKLWEPFPQIRVQIFTTVESVLDQLAMAPADWPGNTDGPVGTGLETGQS